MSSKPDICLSPSIRVGLSALAVRNSNDQRPENAFHGKQTPSFREKAGADTLINPYVSIGWLSSLLLTSADVTCASSITRLDAQEKNKR
mmetsp:Transcript_20049/g.28411  ORF Transcript_20049/g.28411 Transcript_20049/m.28411 type:complete len:89 (-) Transcript_20049:166-432(-)